MVKFLLTLCAVLPLTTGDSQPASDMVVVDGIELHEVEAKVLELTNAERAEYGLPALKLDQNLLKSARRHTAWMTNNRTLQHQGGVAENIATGQSSAREALNAWMNSSGHRANILGRGYRRIGIAAYSTPGGTIYWCQQFGG